MQKLFSLEAGRMANLIAYHRVLIRNYHVFS